MTIAVAAELSLAIDYLLILPCIFIINHHLLYTLPLFELSSFFVLFFSLKERTRPQTQKSHSNSNRLIVAEVFWIVIIM